MTMGRRTDARMDWRVCAGCPGCQVQPGLFGRDGDLLRCTAAGARGRSGEWWSPWTERTPPLAPGGCLLYEMLVIAGLNGTAGD